MKRSGRLKSDPAKVLAWKRRTAKPLPRRGKKGRAWDKVRAAETKACSEAGITACELGYEGCWRDNGLGHAHSLKRRNILSAEELRETIIACNYCHDILERKGEKEMARIVRSIRAGRENK